MRRVNAGVNNKMKVRMFFVGLVLVLAGVVFFNRERLRLYQEQAGLMQRNDQRMRAAEAERAKLLDERSRLRGPSGQEEDARKRGYKKPNETPLELGP